MQDNSDQFATPEEEAAFHEEVIQTDAEEAPEEEQEHDAEAEESEESEEVKPKKDGYVEITDPKVKARVDQLSREKHENHRKAEAERRRADELARKLEEYERPAPPKEVPAPIADPVTDPDAFARQQQEREKYLREATKYEMESEARTQARQQAETQKKNALVEGYAANMARLKLNPQVLAQAAKVCADYGINDNHPLTEDLLEDKDGPAIVKFLADNPEHLAEVASLKPTKALAYIEREIRAKLNERKQSKAPPPPTKVSGTRSSSSSAGGWEIS